MGGRHAAAAVLVLLLALPAPAGAIPDPGPVPLAGIAPLVSFPLDQPFNYSDAVLLGNNNSQTSRNLTLYFQAQRGVPDNNVLFADLPVGETISEAQWGGFVDWWKNETANRSLGSQINYIVTFKGMPIRVSWSHPGNNGPTSFQDALMLLDGPNEARVGTANLWSNPYFNQSGRFSFAAYGIRLVTGIYAYNESTAKGLIDRAAVSLGNRGEYVLDTDSSKGYANSSGQAAWGSYSYANSALVWADAILRARGEQTYLDVNNTYVVNRTGVMGYSSWGSNDCCDGAVTVHSVPQNEWVNGSIAETFVSTGGRTFTWPPSYGQSLIADWIDEGVSGIKGYTDEPYINAIADGHILYDRYTRGYNMAESFWSASHAVGWRQIVIGDPKMAPYSDIGDLAVNTSLTVSPLAVTQGGSFDLTLAVDNTAAVPRDVDLRITLPGGATQNHTLSLPPNAASLFPLTVDVSSVPPPLWGDQPFGLELDPVGAIREWDESNNNGSVSVEIQRVPTASAALDASVVQTFEATVLRLSAPRADRAISHFEWREDGGPWQVANATADEASVPLSYGRSGTHAYEAFAVDVEGLVSAPAGGANLTVTNRAPQAVASANDTAPLSLVPVSLSAAASSDLDGAVATYAWDAGALGAWTDATFQVTFARPGRYTFNLTVTDDEGASASASVVVDVQNRPPTAAAVPDVPEAYTGDPFTVDAGISADPDGTVVRYTFEFDGSPPVEGANPTASHAFAAPGIAGLWVTVEDDWGATARTRVTLRVLDRPPSLSWSLGASVNLTEGQTLSVDVDASDVDSALFSYHVEWGDGAKADGALSGQSAILHLTHGYDFEGAYDIVLTAADVEGNTTEQRSTVRVVHPPPEVRAFSFDGARGNLTISFDIDSPFPELLTVVVYLDGAPWRTFPASGVGSVGLSTEGLAPGNHTVSFEVTDGVKTADAGSGSFSVDAPAPPPDDHGPGGSENSQSTGVGGLLVVGIAAGATAAAAVLLMLWRKRAGAKPPKGPGAT